MHITSLSRHLFPYRDLCMPLHVSNMCFALGHVAVAGSESSSVSPAGNLRGGGKPSGAGKSIIPDPVDSSAKLAHFAGVLRHDAGSQWCCCCCFAGFPRQLPRRTLISTANSMTRRYRRTVLSCTSLVHWLRWWLATSPSAVAAPPPWLLLAHPTSWAASCR